MSPDTSNYFKAKKRLQLSFIIRLVRQIVERIEEKAEAAWLWKGHLVHMIDGSTVSMLDMLCSSVLRELMATVAAKNAAAPREMSFKGPLRALTSFRKALRTADP